MVSPITFVNSFILGLVASFSPCLFPVLPTFLAYLSKKSDSKINGIIASLLVTLGIMTVFVGLTIMYSSIIRFFSLNYLQFRTMQGILLLLLGAFLISGTAFSHPILDKMNAFADSVIQKVENPWLLAYLIGFLFSLLAAPCAIIVFATAFALIIGEPIGISILVMVIFSIGAGVPFFIVGGLVPQLKQDIIDKRQEIQFYLSVSVGILIFGVGTYLTLDGLKLI